MRIDNNDVKQGFVRYTELHNKLDSGLRRNDEDMEFDYCGTLFDSCLQLWKVQ